jgi:hypothetical protein
MASRRSARAEEDRRQRLQEVHRYEVGRHLVRLTQERDGWAVSVDGLVHGQRYASAAEAWSAGLRTAEALDRGRDEAGRSPDLGLATG